MPTNSPRSPTPALHPAVVGLALLALLLGLGIADWRLAAGSTPGAGEVGAAAGSTAGGSVALDARGAGSSGAVTGQAPFTASGRGAAAGRTRAAGGADGAGQSSAARPPSPAVAGEESSAAAGPSVPGGASGALAAYLDGLLRQDPQEVTDSSDGGPLAMAGILLDAAVINAGRGALTTVTEGGSSLAPESVSASKVVYGGAITLTTTISGPRGSGTFTDTVSGPIEITDESGSWRVTSLVYDGQPVEVWTVGRSQTANGLTVSLGYVVSFGATTAALVTLDAQSGSADVNLRSLVLDAGGGSEQGTGDFTGPPRPTGVLRFARVAGAPRSLTLDFAASTGQSDDYSFTIS